MEEITSIIIFVFGILSLILFFKVWGMCNNVKAIREELSKHPRYHYAANSSQEMFKSEITAIEEALFCGRKHEAEEMLKRLQFHIKKEDELYAKRGILYKADIEKKQEELETMQRLIEQHNA